MKEKDSKNRENFKKFPIKKFVLLFVGITCAALLTYALVNIFTISKDLTSNPEDIHNNSEELVYHDDDKPIIIDEEDNEENNITPAISRGQATPTQLVEESSSDDGGGSGHHDDPPVSFSFDNKEIYLTHATSSQTFEITPARNGSTPYTYSEVSGDDLGYFSISDTTVTVAASTPVYTYKYVIEAKDNAEKTKQATYTIHIVDELEFDIQDYSLGFSSSSITLDLPSATGGSGSYQYMATSISSGLSFISNGPKIKILSGEGGRNYSATIKAIDSKTNKEKSASFNISVKDTHVVTFKVVNGTWSDGSTSDIVYEVDDDLPLVAADGFTSIPTGMIANEGYLTPGSWNAIPDEDAYIYNDQTYIYTFEPDPNIPYTVEHYKQKLDETYPDTADYSETFYGYAGESISPTPLSTAQGSSFFGFVDPLVIKTTIAGDGSTKVVYRYVRKSYTVTFDTQGKGNTVNSQSVKYENKATTPTAPSATGYDFGGWFKDKECSYSWNFTSDTVTKNTTLYAKWTPRSDTEYKVEHYKQNLDGTYPETPSDTDNLTGTTDSTVSAVAKTNYEGFVHDSSKSTNTSSGVIKADGSLVLKLYYSREYRTITVESSNTNYGTVNKASLTFKYGSSITFNNNELLVNGASLVKATPKTKTAQYTYSFVKWMIGGNDLTSPYELKEDITITASFKQDLTYYTVKWVNYDGTIVLDSQSLPYGVQPVYAGITPTKPSTTSTHFTFTGWTPTPSEVKGDITYKAQFLEEKNKYKVTFKVVNGTFLNGQDTLVYQNIEHGSYLSLSLIPGDMIPLLGYGNGTWDVTPTTATQITGESTFTYTYNKLKYRVTLKIVNGAWNTAGDNADIVINDVEYGTKVQTSDIPTTMRPDDGYTNGAWDRSPSDTTITTNTSFTYQYVPTGKAMYKVIRYLKDLDGDGYTIADQDGVEIKYGTVDESVTEYDTKKIAGFRYDISKIDEATGTVTADGSLELKLYYNRILYNISINNTLHGNASVASPSSADSGSNSFYFGRTVATQAIPDSGYFFYKWDGESYDNPYVFTVKANNTLTPVYVPANNAPYTVRYFLQNIDNEEYPSEPNLTDVYYGTTGSTVSASQKSFEGFTYNSSLSTPSGKINGDGSLVLDLYYSRSTYTVTYTLGTNPSRANCQFVNGGSSTKNNITETVKYGQKPAHVPGITYNTQGVNAYNDNISATQYYFMNWDKDTDVVIKANTTFTWNCELRDKPVVINVENGYFDFEDHGMVSVHNVYLAPNVNGYLDGDQLQDIINIITPDVSILEYSEANWKDDKVPSITTLITDSITYTYVAQPPAGKHVVTYRIFSTNVKDWASSDDIKHSNTKYELVDDGQSPSNIPEVVLKDANEADRTNNLKDSYNSYKWDGDPHNAVITSDTLFGVVNNVVTKRAVFKINNGYFNLDETGEPDNNPSILYYEPGNDNKLSSDVISLVTSKTVNNNGYMEGNWIPEPTTSIVFDENVKEFIYTCNPYLYEVTFESPIHDGGCISLDGILEENYGISFKEDSGIAHGTVLTIDNNKITFDDGTEIYAVPKTNYAFDNWTLVNDSGDVIQELKGSYTITCPAKINANFVDVSDSRTVTFKIVNGTWANGLTNNITEIVRGSSDYKLKENQIPTGMLAKLGFDNGHWDSAPSVDTEIGSDSVTYTYKFDPIPIDFRGETIFIYTYADDDQTSGFAGATGGSEEFDYSLKYPSEGVELNGTSVKILKDYINSVDHLEVSAKDKHNGLETQDITINIQAVDYLFFKNIGETSGDISLVKSSSEAPNVSIEYSIVDGKWVDIPQLSEADVRNGIYSIKDIPAGQTLYIRAKSSNNRIGYSDELYNYFSIKNSTFEVGGVLYSLINKDLRDESATISDYCFANLFAGQDNLKLASRLRIHNKLSKASYKGMFKGCSNLTYGPALSATTLADECYSNMFSGCSSLLEAPELPASELKTSCYSGMFSQCSSLTETPTLNATNLAESCYSNMFEGCTSIETAPSLPAETLASECYAYMFKDCTSLTTIPALSSATDMSDCTGCYTHMFEGCSSLETAPNLSFVTLCPSCYEHMFLNCTSLTSAPQLSVTTLSTSCYEGMFEGCTSLETAPTLNATTLVNSCYKDMFKGCTSLNSIEIKFTSWESENVLNATKEWVDGVGNSGTFKCPGELVAEQKEFGSSRIPKDNSNQWTISQSSYKVTYKVVGGKYKDTNLTTRSEFVDATSPQFNLIPNPATDFTVDEGYTSTGSWDVNPNTVQSLSADKVFTYSFTPKDLIFEDESLLVPFSSTESQTVSFNVATNGSGDYSYSVSENTDSLTVNNLNITLSADQLDDKDTYTVKIKATDDITGVYEIKTVTIKVVDYVYFTNIGNSVGNVYLFETSTDAPDVSLEYSFEDEDWEDLTKNLISNNEPVGGTVVSVDRGAKVFIRAKSDNTAFYNNEKTAYDAFGLKDSSFNVSGDICKLIKNSGDVQPLSEYAFAYLFANQSNLVSAKDLIIPNVINKGCFKGMFINCSALKDAPTLPSINLTEECYAYMFSGCSNLETAPTLAAQTLAKSCYAYMFNGCTSLTSTPDLDAITLKDSCYSHMFDGCSNLTIFTSLKATTLADNCCSYMFKDCTKLVNVPSTLPATSLTPNCYSYMFANTGITKSPKLPATILAVNCYSHIFDGCSNLTLFQEDLPATTLAEGCYQYMFQDCISLVNAPDLLAETLVNGCYDYMFYRCSNLNNIEVAFKDWNNGLSTTNWLGYVSNLGTFTCPGELVDPLDDSNLYNFSHVPYNTSSKWTIDRTSFKVTYKLIGATFKDTSNDTRYVYVKKNETAPTPVVDTDFTINTGYESPGTWSPSAPGTITSESTFTYELSKSERTVTLQIENGAWSSTVGDNADKTIKVNYGQKPSSAQIPSTMVAKAGYGNGYWHTSGSTTPITLTDQVINEDITYIYTFKANDLVFDDQKYMATYNYSSSESFTFTAASNGSGTYTYSIDDIPTGISISNNTITLATSTLTTKGNKYELSVKATDSNTLATKTSTITIEVVDYLYLDNVGDSTGEIMLQSSGTAPTISLQYSLAKEDWKPLTIANPVYVNDGEKLYIRATSTNATISSSKQNYNSLYAHDSNFKVGGNVVTLLNKEGTVTSLPSYAFAYLFSDYSGKLISALDLVLPSSNLSEGCYYGMFYNCKNLTQVPILSATTLAKNCYYFMYYGCESLTSVPSDYLPASSLAESCYKSMFYGSGLTSTPTLPATTLYKECYSNMFRKCTSLTSCSSDLLPATTLADSCYQYMLSGTAITTAPELNATVLADNCYANMFQACSSLKNSMNILPAETLAVGCYKSMFANCKVLENAPVLPAKTLADNCYQAMFGGCNKINELYVAFKDWNAAGLSTKSWASSLPNSGTFNCFEELDTSLNDADHVPSGWNVKFIRYVCFENTGSNSGTVSLKANGDSPSVSLKYSDDLLVWNDYTVNTNINLEPGKKVYFRASNSGNKKLASGSSNYNYFSTTGDTTFAVSGDATALLDSGGDVKVLTEYNEHCFDSLFKGCTSLTNASALKLPSTTLVGYCYASMFDGCSALENAPELPATNLVTFCYGNMFNGCSKLDNLSASFTSWYADATDNWVNGVASSGTFNGSAGLQIINDNSHIPNGWVMNPFYFRNTGNDTGIVRLMSDGTNIPTIALQYSKDLKAWQPYTVGSDINLEPGEKAYFRATTSGNTTISNSTGYHYFYTFGDTTFSASGDITQLLNLNGSVLDLSGKEYCFSKLFAGSTKLVDVSKLILPSTTLSPYCYESMFYKCPILEKAPDVLPATILAEGCYSSMFDTCKALITVPNKLPATNLAPYCYENMFSTCTSLTSVSEDFLPATNLADSCYSGMFAAAPLTVLPKLPATTLADNCYETMYLSCTSLLSVDSDYLPAQNLAPNCYKGMFNRCTKLTNAPELPATTLADNCYNKMFTGCSKLTSAPDLQATTLTDSCYYQMFSGCTQLINAPALPALNLANNCYDQMFAKCTRLVNAPELPATTLASNCYNGMFNGCKALISAPYLPAKTLVDGCYTGMFNACTNLKNISVNFTNWNDAATSGWVKGVSASGSFVCPTKLDTTLFGDNNIPTGWTVVRSLCFKNTGNTTGKVKISKTGSAPLIYMTYSSDLITWNPYTIGTDINVEPGKKVYFRAPAENANTSLARSDSAYNSFVTGDTTFSVSGDITSLLDSESIVSTLSSDCCFSSLFKECSQITDASSLELPSTTLSSYCYNSMFDSCTGLEKAPELPATTLSEGCYLGMFYNCTSLEIAPELPAKTLVENCYQGMFNGCSNLNTITVGFESWADEIDATDAWVAGVSATGTFTCPSSLPRNIFDMDHIPSIAWINPFHITNIGDSNSTVSLIAKDTAPSVNLVYSKDLITWSPYTVGQAIDIAQNEDVYFIAGDGGNTQFGSSGGYNFFKFGSNSKFSASGDITTLLDAQGSLETLPADYCFRYLFDLADELIDASELTLPSTTLTQYCYSGMFIDCSNLVNGPKVLPSTTLAKNCYDQMFSWCVSLTAAPFLPAPQLVSGSYFGMFSYCVKLNYIKVGLTRWDTKCSNDWVYKVTAEGVIGTFVCPSSLKLPTPGSKTTPPGWIIERYDPE